MTPRRPSFRSTLDALSHAFVDAVLLAVRRAVLTDLAGALDPVPATALPAARKTRKAVQAARTPHRSKAAPPSVPTRSSRSRSASPTRRQLELPLDPHPYPETVIVAPDVTLGALPPTVPVVAVGDASARVTVRVFPPSEPRPRTPRRPRSAVVPADEGQAAQAPQRAPDPVPRAGEVVLRAPGGGAVLRRRRAPVPSSPTGAAE